MNKLITLIVMTTIGAFSSVAFFSEHFWISTGAGFIAGLLIIAEVQVYCINREFAQWREEMQEAP